MRTEDEAEKSEKEDSSSRIDTSAPVLAGSRIAVVSKSVSGEFWDMLHKGMEDAVKDADAVLFVIPTKAIRSVAKELVAKLNTKPVIIHASKGLEQGTHKRISEILLEEIPTEKRKAVAVLSGPSHAEEVAKHDITTITAASTDVKAAKYVQELFMNHYFRIYTN